MTGDCSHHWTVTSECPFCLRAEIERLRAAIVRWNETGRKAAEHPEDFDLEADHVEAEGDLIKIAREGR